MEAFNAVGLTPISSLLSKPRKFSPHHQTTTNHVAPPPPMKSSSSSDYSALNNNRSFHGGLVLLSSSVLQLSPCIAHSLTYEEALQQSMTTSNYSSSSSEVGSSFDVVVSGILDGIISFSSENPLVVAGAALALPLVLLVFKKKKPKPWGIETARTAYAKLGDDADAQLLDIRAPAELRQVGGPDVGGLRKKPVPIVYKGDDKSGFLKKLSFKFKDPENTTLFILDKFDGNSELVAELVTVNGFKAAFAIKDGAEGPRGWMNSGLPWAPPKKGFSLDLSSLTDAISGTVGDGLDGLSVALSIAVAAGLGALAFTEVETILQVLGSAALIQFVSKKLLFAEVRKQTIQQLDEFVNNKVGPKELVDDVKQIGKALLPLPVTSSKVLPAPTTTTTPAAAATTEETVSTEATSSSVEKKIEEAGPVEEEEVVVVNSVPKPEPEVVVVVKADSLIIPRPQSPYPYYPDLKPPTSPSPSQP